MNFDASNWYWTVAGDSDRVYSSARNLFVPLNDPEYEAWGNSPTPIASEAELWQVLRQLPAHQQLPDWQFDGENFVPSADGVYSKAQLKAYAAGVRWSKEIAGATVGGVAYLSDRETQSKLTAAVVMAQVNPSTSFQWKTANGSFTTLDAAGMLQVATAVGSYVQTCFAIESTAATEIDDDLITSTAEIEAAFANVV